MVTDSKFATPDEQQLAAINRAIQLHAAGDLPAASAIYQQVAMQQLAVPEVYSNLATIYYPAGHCEEAKALWARALTLDPNHVHGLVHLGMALKTEGALEQAEQCYRRALELQPGLAEVQYNLANLLQERGDSEAAADMYLRALDSDPTLALAQYNLGNIHRNQGQLKQALEHFARAVELEPGNMQFHNNLGNAYTQLDQLKNATACYQRALELDANYADALYNLGNAHYLLGELEQASVFFTRSRIRDWASRSLYCYYKTGQVERFDKQLEETLTTQHLSPQVAALSAHNAISRQVEDRYQFCPQPLSFIYRAALAQLADPAAPLRLALLELLDTLPLDARHQGRLHRGMQSSGNLFLRSEPALQELAALVCDHFGRYRTQFSDAPCTLTSHFPQTLEFESSWFIRMRQGGHLDGHIHETGWLSGVVYLALPSTGREGNAGHINFSLHGDDYPRQGTQSFPEQTEAIAAGDIVLFPSSLFHRTIPYQSDEERICIAFDLAPAPPANT
jgi:tetratricopeptide (TPR) repeat protein